MIQEIEIEGEQILVLSILELDEAIEQHLEKTPKDKKWKDRYTLLSKTANEIAGFKRHREIF